MDRRTMLETRVRAVNASHAYANELYDLLLSVYEPLVGTKIEKLSGQLLAKVEAAVKQLNLPNTPKLMVYRRNNSHMISNYSEGYTVKACETTDGRSFYDETTVYIGESSSGVFNKINPRVVHRCDYDADEIEMLRRNCEAAAEAYRDARSALYPFGESDM